MKKIVLFFLLHFSLNLCFSQSVKGFQIPDSLNKKTYKYLESAFNSTVKSDSKKRELYANSILLKGKKEKNETGISDGYQFLYRSKSDPSFLDSMIIISKKSQDFDNISIAYLLKGNHYYFTSDYSKSLNNYLLAKDFSKNNEYNYNVVNFNIGLLKLELGNYREAQKLFLGYKKYLDGEQLTDKIDYISCLYTIAYTYTKMDQLDLSDSFIRLGLEINSKLPPNDNYLNLLLTSGINQYKRKEYLQAQKTLENVSKQIKDHSYNTQNLALSEFYIGMSQYENKDYKFLDTFKKVDSLINKTKYLTSELRGLYPILIEHYKKLNDKEKQLFYIEHLLDFDRILNKNSHHLSTEINEKYDTPILLKEKEKLISDLNSKNTVLYWISGIIGSAVFILLFLYFKKSKKVKHYEEQAILLTKNSEPLITTIIEGKYIDENHDTGRVKNQISKTVLSEELLNSLYLKFESFETKKEFLNRNLNLDILAKEFETNRDYLSKAVKELKGKSFSQYVNELRITYLIEELKINPNLQKLTIAGIAEEAGFNNSETFTSAFKKITGTLPSYYLKALKEEHKRLS
ncbi:helix-turn-helix transcriptional regulator [Chryseobacterium gotjawalense]|uniref:Helix-turn-helix transcriptional regulator n=1 Tax=Chryseobacterium gotjawalense TaxID=3042315 RepID=A0ABY8RF66_9FLAO|nr:helix-turn-helix transcriptional regulator [Chryseobacterium sp. wdc7]WHF52610.1 helix-turn-helix transcriptional regulator [Chryseobacterium sp. wdc7]